MPSQELRTITARVPLALHEAITRLAEQRSESINALVAQALAREVSDRDRKELFDSFTLIGRDSEESDVQFGCLAQSEVALGA